MKGRCRQGLVGVACLLVVLTGTLGAAPPARAQAPEAAFEVSAVSVRGEAPAAPTRLDLYTRVPHASLHFLRAAEGFAARYEMTAEAYRLDEDGERQALVERRVWEREVAVADFEATRSRRQFDAAAQSMALPAGRYRLVVQLSDRATDEVLRRTLNVQVRDLSGPVAVSDLILLDAFDAASNTIAPRVSDRFSTEERTLQVFYELYTDAPRRVRVTREVMRLPGGGLPIIGALFGGEGDEVEGKITYTQVETTPLRTERTPVVVTIPIDASRAGEYLVRVTVKDENGRTLDSTERRFTLAWTGLVAHVRNLDEAIEQLRYVAKGSDLDYIRAGATRAERRARFEAFWDKRDPTPGTERNERMEEYYYRVARANRAYGEGEEGWTTDRGHVLVLFGEPDNVERHPYNADGRPYEVWHYTRIGRRFIFVDQGGGVFKLLEPIWNEPSRIR